MLATRHAALPTFTGLAIREQPGLACGSLPSLEQRAVGVWGWEFLLLSEKEEPWMRDGSITILLLLPVMKDSDGITHHKLGPVVSIPCSDMLTALALSVTLIMSFTAELPVGGKKSLKLPIQIFKEGP